MNADYTQMWVNIACRFTSFGYHEGKEIIRALELDAWRYDQKIRMLNQFQWRDLRYTLLGGIHTDKDGNKIIFHSKAQFEKFSRIISRTETSIKILRQLNSGEIVLQHVFEDQGRCLGYLSIIGNRGGVRTEHGHSVEFCSGEAYLTKAIGPLFELREKPKPKIEDHSPNKGQLPLLSFKETEA